MFITFCEARSTLKPAEEIYSNFSKSNTNSLISFKDAFNSASKAGAVVVSNLPTNETFNVSTDYLLGINSTSTVSVAGLTDGDINFVCNTIYYLRERNKKGK